MPNPPTSLRLSDEVLTALDDLKHHRGSGSIDALLKSIIDSLVKIQVLGTVVIDKLLVFLADRGKTLAQTRHIDQTSPPEETIAFIGSLVDLLQEPEDNRDSREVVNAIHDTIHAPHQAGGQSESARAGRILRSIRKVLDPRESA